MFSVGIDKCFELPVRALAGNLQKYDPDPALPGARIHLWRRRIPQPYLFNIPLSIYNFLLLFFSKRSTDHTFSLASNTIVVAFRRFPTGSTVVVQIPRIAKMTTFKGSGPIASTSGRHIAGLN